MTATPRSPEQRIVLDNITWDVYESLLLVNCDRRVPRFTYDRGRLEIVSPSYEHEQITEKVALLVAIIAEEMGINAEGAGSTTFQREDLDRGFEPDACFYIANLEKVRGKITLDLRVDPPPDLVIEVDITSSSLDKFSIWLKCGSPKSGVMTEKDGGFSASRAWSMWDGPKAPRSQV